MTLQQITTISQEINEMIEFNIKYGNASNTLELKPKDYIQLCNELGINPKSTLYKEDKAKLEYKGWTVYSTYMTLITKILKELEDPKNREIVNSGQSEFQLSICAKGTMFIEWTEEAYWGVDHHSMNNWEITPKDRKFTVIRHCINLLPCFDVKNPELKLKQVDVESYQHKISSNQTDFWWGYNKGRAEAEFAKLPKTIRQALLCSGAMTIEDLEQEYLKLIK